MLNFMNVLAQTTTVVAPTILGFEAIYFAYAIFLAVVIIFLALDLGVFHRVAHEVNMKEAATWSVIWVTLGLLFSVVVYFSYQNHWLGLGLQTRMFNDDLAAVQAGAPAIIYGEQTGWKAAVQYLTGYVVEKSLAMDNIFVIAMIFGFFAIPGKYQHRVLFWGIIGALVMRGTMIGIGGELIMKYQWILIIFGAFLLLTALKMAIIKSESDPSKNPIVRLVKRFYPVTDQFHGQKFFIRVSQKELDDSKVLGHKIEDHGKGSLLAPGEKGILAMTPLFLALMMVEITDLVFAVDSIPAIFAITPDPFIVFTSNIFAVLGLRALYFCLAALILKFRYLKPALIFILIFVGIKLLLLSVPPYLDVIGLSAQKPIKIDPLVALAVVVALLLGAVVLSILRPAPTQTDPTKAH